MFREFEISCVDALETTPHGKIFNMKKKKTQQANSQEIFQSVVDSGHLWELLFPLYANFFK